MGPDHLRGQTTEAIRGHRQEESVGSRQVQLPHFVQKNLWLKPNTLNFVAIPEVKGIALFEPVYSDAECGALPAVYKATQKVAMLNLSKKTKLIPKGTKISKVILKRQLQAEE